MQLERSKHVEKLSVGAFVSSPIEQAWQAKLFKAADPTSQGEPEQPEQPNRASQVEPGHSGQPNQGSQGKPRRLGQPNRASQGKPGHSGHPN